MDWYQQGDVTLKPVDEIPSDGKLVGKDNVVLREGEATGHMHRAFGAGVLLYAVAEQLYLQAQKGAQVFHDEHGTIDLPAGDYLVGGVKEFDYESYEQRYVYD